jgi:predicted dehydrogenase
MPAHAQAAWQIVGTRGSLTLGMTSMDGPRIVHDEISPEKGGVTSTVIFEGRDPDPCDNPCVIQDFAEAIRRQRSPATGLEQALVIARLSDAIYASAHARRAVELD